MKTFWNGIIGGAIGLAFIGFIGWSSLGAAERDEQRGPENDPSIEIAFERNEDGYPVGKICRFLAMPDFSETAGYAKKSKDQFSGLTWDFRPVSNVWRSKIRISHTFDTFYEGRPYYVYGYTSQKQDGSYLWKYELFDLHGHRYWKEDSVIVAIYEEAD